MNAAPGLTIHLSTSEESAQLQRELATIEAQARRAERAVQDALRAKLVGLHLLPLAIMLVCWLAAGVCLGFALGRMR